MKRSTFVGQEVKGQSHKRPKIDLEAWRRHHFRPLGRVAYLEYLSRDRLGGSGYGSKISGAHLYTVLHSNYGSNLLSFRYYDEGTDDRRTSVRHLQLPMALMVGQQ